MPRPPTLERDEVLARLTTAFRAKGYDATSLADLSAAAGLQRASLYHFFPGGKKEMALAVVASVMAAFRERVELKDARQDTPRKRLLRLIRAFEHYFGGSDQLCVLGSVAASTAAKDIAADVRASFEVWIRAVASTLREGGLSPSEARGRALESIALYQGAVVLRRGLGDEAVFESLARRARAHLLEGIDAP